MICHDGVENNYGRQRPRTSFQVVKISARENIFYVFFFYVIRMMKVCTGSGHAKQLVNNSGTVLIFVAGIFKQVFG